MFEAKKQTYKMHEVKQRQKDEKQLGQFFSMGANKERGRAFL